MAQQKREAQAEGGAEGGEAEMAAAAVQRLVAKRAKTAAAVKTVAILGGTHGNELAGPALVHYFQSEPALVARPTFETQCVLSNLKAIEANRRYIDTDMNRCFDFAALSTSEKTPEAERNAEQQRSLELNELLGPKFSEEPKTDLILDLHNTTSNTGVLLCLHKEDSFARELAAYVRQQDSQVCATFWPQDDPPFLPTVSRSGMTFEVGPLPHSTMRAAVFEHSKKLLLHALDYVELHNQHAAGGETASSLERITVKMPVAERVAAVDYPRGENNRLTAFIHPDLQGISELRPGGSISHGSPIFQTEAGDTVALDVEQYDLPKDEVFFPMFVNEAAYYEKGVAFFLTRVTEHEVSILAKKQDA
ncbi:N-acyl-aromatic-L-amino acid amidohydrolase carboxylate-forming [Hondaea fermentalgiana]|uniref:N-acyl-aromatic-L-amino acid amidohydrolase carboxylate-forming n=1 Tax=Hondaea fermentalgiana TaxID=2315210 RepID=A0A2R5GNG4_9STRA|nr:N-acyl-aromatic-L-amino acid amidohydrolase carboxylate-forming [Hondaea fermentalgiana]|eukprot:GBG32442.1 N-acyl-aromatic-L-amino acid amidohydrolase carboxylate-forming [Hondaea fermentalgiana]